jgi:hypothetical protein
MSPVLVCLPDVPSGGSSGYGHGSSSAAPALVLHSSASCSEVRSGASAGTGSPSSVARGLCSTEVRARAGGARRAAAVWAALRRVLALPSEPSSDAVWGEPAEAAARAWLRAAAAGMDPLVPGAPLRARRGPVSPKSAAAATAAVPRSAAGGASAPLLCAAYFTPQYALALDSGSARGFAWDADDVYAFSARAADDALAVERLAPTAPDAAAVRKLLAAAGLEAAAAGADAAGAGARRGASFTLPLRGFPAHIADGALRSAADGALALLAAAAPPPASAAPAAAAAARRGPTTPGKRQSPLPPPPPRPPLLSSETSLATLLALSKMHTESAHQLQRMLAAGGAGVSPIGPADFRPLNVVPPRAADGVATDAAALPPREALMPPGAADNKYLAQLFSASAGADGGSDEAFRRALVARTLAHSTMLCTRIDAALT